MTNFWHLTWLKFSNVIVTVVIGVVALLGYRYKIIRDTKQGISDASIRRSMARLREAKEIDEEHLGMSDPAVIERLRKHGYERE